METLAQTSTRHVELSAKVFPPCKNCGQPMGDPHPCPDYQPDGPIRDLGVIVKGEL